MQQFSLTFLGFVLVSSLWSGEARADEEVANDQQLDLTLTLDEPADPTLSYVDFERKHLEESARRSRNALIATSAATAIGAALFYPLVLNCIEFYPVEGSPPKCGRGREVGVTISGMVQFGGLIGTLVTGIMYGVRKGKLRRLDDRGKYGKVRAVRFDPDRGSFVF